MCDERCTGRAAHSCHAPPWAQVNDFLTRVFETSAALLPPNANIDDYILKDRRYKVTFEAVRGSSLERV